MDGVVADHQEEGLLLLVPPTNEGLRFIGLAVGEVLALFATGQVVNPLPEGLVAPLGLVVGIKVAGRLTVIAAAPVFVVTLPGGKPRGVPEMPLPNITTLVAAGLEGLRDGDFLVLHPVGIGGAEERAVLAADILGRILGGSADPAPLEAGTDPVGHSDPVWIAAGLQGGAGRGTDGAGGVAVGEAEALGGEAVDGGGLVVVASLAGEIHPAHVVDQDDNHIGMVCRAEVSGEGENTEKRGEERFHGLWW